MNSYVGIILPEYGWILEKDILAITSRLPYAHPVPDPNALITYYVTYAKWERKVSP